MKSKNNVKENKHAKAICSRLYITIKGTVKLYFFFAKKDAPSVYKKRDVFIFPKFHL